MMSKFYNTPLPDNKIIYATRQLAQNKSIELNGFNTSSHARIASHYELNVKYGKLGGNRDGAFLNNTIILGSHLHTAERRNFTFFHELMHYFIQEDDDLLSMIHDSVAAANNDIDKFIERLCNLGAAEILLPTNRIQNFTKENGFSVEYIPILCTQYNASAIAVAIQMTTTAKHRCYLFIAEPRIVNTEVMLSTKYTVESSAARYSMSRNAIIPRNHLMYRSLKVPDKCLERSDIIPLRSGKEWYTKCSCMYYRRNVYCIFNVEAPPSHKQLELF